MLWRGVPGDIVAKVKVLNETYKVPQEVIVKALLNKFGSSINSLYVTGNIDSQVKTLVSKLTAWVKKAPPNNSTRKAQIIETLDETLATWYRVNRKSENLRQAISKKQIEFAGLRATLEKTPLVAARLYKDLVTQYETLRQQVNAFRNEPQALSLMPRTVQKPAGFANLDKFNKNKRKKKYEGITNRASVELFNRLRLSARLLRTFANKEKAYLTSDPTVAKMIQNKTLSIPTLVKILVTDQKARDLFFKTMASELSRLLTQQESKWTPEDRKLVYSLSTAYTQSSNFRAKMDSLLSGNRRSQPVVFPPSPFQSAQSTPNQTTTRQNVTQSQSQPINRRQSTQGEGVGFTKDNGLENLGFLLQEGQGGQPNKPQNNGPKNNNNNSVVNQLQNRTPNNRNNNNNNDPTLRENNVTPFKSVFNGRREYLNVRGKSQRVPIDTHQKVRLRARSIVRQALFGTDWKSSPDRLLSLADKFVVSRDGPTLELASSKENNTAGPKFFDVIRQVRKRTVIEVRLGKVDAPVDVIEFKQKREQELVHVAQMAWTGQGVPFFPVVYGAARTTKRSFVLFTESFTDTMASWLQSGKKTPSEYASGLVQVLVALAALHGQGISHGPVDARGIQVMRHPRSGEEWVMSVGEYQLHIKKTGTTMALDLSRSAPWGTKGVRSPPCEVIDVLKLFGRHMRSRHRDVIRALAVMVQRRRLDAAAMMQDPKALDLLRSLSPLAFRYTQGESEGAQVIPQGYQPFKGPVRCDGKGLFESIRGFRGDVQKAFGAFR